MDDATRSLLAGYVRRYSLVGGAVVTLCLVGGFTHLLSIGARSVLLFSAVLSFGLAVIPFSVSDSGLESAGVGVAGGFDVTNPTQYRGGTNRPFRYKVAFVCLGTGGYCVVGFLLLGVV